MHVSALIAIEDELLPAIGIKGYLQVKQKNTKPYKEGTHLQDATLTLGQEISGWAGMLERSKSRIMSNGILEGRS